MMRLARRMALAGLCSRRQAEQWILQGRVAVNGDVITTPAHTVQEQDQITVDGHPIQPSTQPRLWRYYKPCGLVTTHKDPEGRPTVFQNLPPDMPRVISVGRLDLNSEGLLLLTNHGGLARFLEHPDQAFDRTYRVRIYGQLSSSQRQHLKKGMVVEGVHYRPMQVKVADPSTCTGRNQWITLTLQEGKNREIRKVMTALGVQVNRLIRVGYGPIALGDLQPGACQEVTPWPQELQGWEIQSSSTS